MSGGGVVSGSVSLPVNDSELAALKEYWANWVQCSAVDERRDDVGPHYLFCSDEAGHDGPHSWERG